MRLHPSADVLDAPLVQHVVADLLPPAWIRTRLIQQALDFFPLALFMIVQLGHEAFPGNFTVVVLASIVLTLHHDARGNMRQPDGRVGLVDVLSTSARCPEGVDAHVRGIHQHSDRLIHLWIDEDRCKAGLPATRRIERALSDQPMGACLGPQQTVRIRTRYLTSSRP